MTSTNTSRGTSTPIINASSASPSDTLYPQRAGEADCRDYLRTGRCKYGESCKYHHPPDVESGGGRPLYRPGSDDPSEPPFPIRPGEPPCPYFLKHGTCKFGRSCKFHHPAGPGPTPGGSHPLGLAQRVGLGLGMGLTASEAAPYGNGHGNSLPFGYVNGHVGNINRANVSVNGHPLPSGVTAVLLSSNAHINVHANGHVSAIGGGFGVNASAATVDVHSNGSHVLPQRTSEPDCIYFLRNGRCKYGSTCKFHHPMAAHPYAQPDRGGLNMGSSPRLDPRAPSEVGDNAGTRHASLMGSAILAPAAATAQPRHQPQPSRDRSSSFAGMSDGRSRSLSSPLLHMHSVTDKRQNQGRRTPAPMHVKLPDGQIAVVLEPQTLKLSTQAPPPTGDAQSGDRDAYLWRGDDGGSVRTASAPRLNFQARDSSRTTYSGSVGSLSFSSSPMMAASPVSSYGNDTAAFSIDVGSSHCPVPPQSNHGGDRGSQAQFHRSGPQGQGQPQFLATTTSWRNDSGGDLDQRSTGGKSGSYGSLSAYGSVDSGPQMPMQQPSPQCDYYSSSYAEGLCAPNTPNRPPQHQLSFVATVPSTTHIDGGFHPYQLGYEDHRLRATSFGSIAEEPVPANCQQKSPNEPPSPWLYRGQAEEVEAVGGTPEEGRDTHSPSDDSLTYGSSTAAAKVPPINLPRPPEDGSLNRGVAGHDDDDEGLTLMTSALLTMMDSHEGPSTAPSMIFDPGTVRGPPPGLALLDDQAGCIPHRSSKDSRKYGPSPSGSWPGNGHAYRDNSPPSWGNDSEVG